MMGAAASGAKGKRVCLELNKKEYQHLLQVLEMADWILNAHGHEEDKKIKPFTDLEQKVFALANDIDCGALIEYSEEHRQYLPTRAYEETSSAMPRIEEFENETFWDELIDRLAERDLLSELGKKAFLALPPSERMLKMDAGRERYSLEMEKHGIDRLGVVAEAAPGKRK